MTSVPWVPPTWRRWLIGILLAFACLNALLAIVYSHRPAADLGIALQDKDIWEEAAFFAAL